MKHKVSELQGALLDAAVANCEGLQYDIGPDGRRSNVMRVGWNAPADWAPSTDWAQGGPIIERERINICPYDEERWGSVCGSSAQFGPTPLIAAMRAYVAKFGEEVELP